MESEPQAKGKTMGDFEGHHKTWALLQLEATTGKAAVCCVGRCLGLLGKKQHKAGEHQGTAMATKMDMTRACTRSGWKQKWSEWSGWGDV